MKAELFNFRCWINESETSLLKKSMHAILVKCDFEILGQIDHQFKPQGYTALWLLGESHLAIHTYPEHNTTYIELTSCACDKNQIFIDEIKKLYQVSQQNIS